MHSYKFDITDTFFDFFEYSIIHKGKVSVDLQLEKKETMLVGDYKIGGIVQTECDRCNDPVDVKVEGEYQLVYKFDTKPSDDESLVIVYPEVFEIDVKENILELITVSLPSRAVHEEGGCNEEMMDLLSEYVLISNDEVEETSEEAVSDEEEYIDPRWSALNKLKKTEAKASDGQSKDDPNEK